MRNTLLERDRTPLAPKLLNPTDFARDEACFTRLLAPPPAATPRGMDDDDAVPLTLTDRRAGSLPGGESTGDWGSSEPRSGKCEPGFVGRFVKGASGSESSSTTCVK